MKRFVVHVMLMGLVGMSSLAFGAGAPAPSEQTSPLVFGFLPIVSTQKLLARFGPLTDYLSDRLGRPVRFETAPNYAEFIQRTNHDRRYDILFTAPHFYHMAQRKAGYQVLVRVRAPQMRAIIVTADIEKIKSVADLRGRKIAVPDSLSLGALLVKNHLLQAGLRPGRDVELVTTPSHNASLVSAYKGVTDAAGMMIPPFKRASSEIKSKMQIIATTRGTPHMPISVAARLSVRDRNKISQVLLDMQKTLEGKKLLRQISWPGFVKTSTTEYDQMDWAAKLVHQ